MDKKREEIKNSVFNIVIYKNKKIFGVDIFKVNINLWILGEKYPTRMSNAGKLQKL